MRALIFFITAVFKTASGNMVPSAILKSRNLEALFRDTRMPTLLKSLSDRALRRVYRCAQQHRTVHYQRQGALCGLFIPFIMIQIFLRMTKKESSSSNSVYRSNLSTSKCPRIISRTDSSL